MLSSNYCKLIIMLQATDSHLIDKHNLQFIIIYTQSLLLQVCIKPHHSLWACETGKLLNSLSPGKFEWNFRHVIFKRILVIDGWHIYCEIALIWMSLDFTDDQSTLVQVMAWCHQATSHCLTQCWPRSLSPSGVTRSQRVKFTAGRD